MEIPRPSPEKQAELDAALAEVLRVYWETPYSGRDPHGLYPYIEEIVKRQHPDWNDFKTAIMATAATADVAAQLAIRAQVENPGTQWKEI